MPLYTNGGEKKGLLYKGKLGEATLWIPEYDVSSIRDSRLISGMPYNLLQIISYFSTLP